MKKMLPILWIMGLLCTAFMACEQASDDPATVVVTYTVTYDKNGATSGSVPVNQTKTEDEPLILAANSGNLAKTGYTFAGWNTKTDGTGIGYSAGASYTTNADVTLYATWTNGGIRAIISQSNDITIDQIVKENIITFTADTGCTLYSWYVDGKKQTDTDNVFDFDMSTRSAGVYDIELYVIKNGIAYSAQFSKTVGGSN